LLLLLVRCRERSSERDPANRGLLGPSGGGEALFDAGTDEDEEDLSLPELWLEESPYGLWGL